MMLPGPPTAIEIRFIMAGSAVLTCDGGPRDPSTVFVALRGSVLILL